MMDLGATKCLFVFGSGGGGGGGVGCGGGGGLVTGVNNSTDKSIEVRA